MLGETGCCALVVCSFLVFLDLYQMSGSHSEGE